MMSYSRRLLRSPGGRGLAAFIGLGYALLSMSASGMIEWGAGGPWAVGGRAAGAAGTELIVRAPGVTAVLPLGPTLLTLVVSAGVGIGLAVAVSLSIRWRSSVTRSPLGANPAASLASLTPSMMALATLGACCSTITSSAPGLLPSWGQGLALAGPPAVAPELLGLVQALLLGAALLAQERLLSVFAVPLGLAVPDRPAPESREASWRRHFVGGLPFAMASLGLGLAGAFVAVGALLAPSASGLPGAALLAASARGGTPDAVALLLLLGPALLAVLGSERTLGWVRPSLDGSLRGLGRAYAAGPDPDVDGEYRLRSRGQGGLRPSLGGPPAGPPSAGTTDGGDPEDLPAPWRRRAVRSRAARSGRPPTARALARSSIRSPRSGRVSNLFTSEV